MFYLSKSLLDSVFVIFDRSFANKGQFIISFQMEYGLVTVGFNVSSFVTWD